MPKTKQKVVPEDKQRKTSQTEGESVSGYFRAIFKANPKLLQGRSNQELLQRWLDDHPGEKVVPTGVKNSLSNLKSVLRKKRRQKKGKGMKPEQPAVTAPAVEAPPPKTAIRGLETLEEQIDGCMTLAKNLDREALASVVQLLRRARNAVVWQQGQ